MRLSKFFQVLLMVTVVALTYIHMQMQIFDLAYQDKSKEKTIAGLLEDNGRVAYHILQLKSSRHLGGKLLAKDSSLRFRDNGNVVQLVTSQFIPEEKEVLVAVESKWTNPILNFFSLRAEAEARAQEENSVKPRRRGL